MYLEHTPRTSLIARIPGFIQELHLCRTASMGMDWETEIGNMPDPARALALARYTLG